MTSQPFVTFKILIMIMIAFLMIDAWNEVIVRSINLALGLDPESIWSWLLIAIVSTVFVFAVGIYFGVGAQDLLGFSKIDDDLTKQAEIEMEEQKRRIYAESELLISEENESNAHILPRFR